MNEKKHKLMKSQNCGEHCLNKNLEWCGVRVFKNYTLNYGTSRVVDTWKNDAQNGVFITFFKNKTI